MPRKRLIIVGVVAVIAIVIALVIALPDRGGDARVNKPSTSADTASGTASSPAIAVNKSGSAGSHPLRSTSSPPTSPTEPTEIPPEAIPKLDEALAAGHTGDAVQLCASAPARAAYPAECTIAACREHLEARARTWFATVPEADRSRVAQACEEAKVTVTRPIRIRPHRHRRGEVD